MGTVEGWGGAYYGMVGGPGDTQPWLQQGDGRELKASEQGREQEFFFCVKLFEHWVPVIAGWQRSTKNN